MGEKDESAWVFDSLVGFLQGPIWSTPLMTFIEEKSIVFEPQMAESQDYGDVYQDYKNLVDLLLGCYMEDIGITPEQFERACMMNRDTRVPVQFQQSLFEQIWAANEYEVFKRMMIQKNVELQLQALNIIEEKKEITVDEPNGYEPDSMDNELPMDEIKREMEQEVKDGEWDITKNDYLLAQERERLAAEYQVEKNLLSQALKQTVETFEIAPGIKKPLDTVDENEEENAEGPTQIKQTITNSEKITIRPKSPTKEEDIRKRQQYLAAQRDKLVALKKQKRSQKLSVKNSRPTSARVAAEAAVDGKKQIVPSSLEPSAIQVRQALAARLKAEVVQK